MSDLTAKPETTNTLRPGGRQARVMAQSLALVEESGPALARKTLAAAGLGFLALLAWAGFIEIDDATKVFGQVIPAGDAETVLHPDGGTISEILVSEGEVVEQGQILIRFDAGEAKAELEQMETRRAEVGLMAAAFRALNSGGEPDFSFVSSVYQPQAENEKLIFANLKQSMEKRRNVLSARAVNMQEKLGNIAEQEKALAKKASLLEDELELRQDLYKKGQAEKKVYLFGRARRRGGSGPRSSALLRGLAGFGLGALPQGPSFSTAAATRTSSASRSAASAASTSRSNSSMSAASSAFSWWAHK